MICLIILLFFVNVNCQSTTESVVTALGNISFYLDTAHVIDRYHRRMMKSRASEFQIQQVNITAKYRMLKMIHENYTLRYNDSKWRECITLFHKNIDAFETKYPGEESKCLKDANARVGMKRRTVNQLTKQIKQWRKSYKYLENLCNKNFPGDAESARNCLYGYLKRDNYDTSLERLLSMKDDAMSTLHKEMTTSLGTLERCLQGNILKYLRNLQTIMTHLEGCYSRKIQGSDFRKIQGS